MDSPSRSSVPCPLSLAQGVGVGHHAIVWNAYASCMPLAAHPPPSLQALDDPIAPADAIPYEALAANAKCVLATTPTGGHLGWVAGRGAPWGAPWSDQVMTEWLEAVLQQLRNHGPPGGGSGGGSASMDAELLAAQQPAGASQQGERVPVGVSVSVGAGAGYAEARSSISLLDELLAAGSGRSGSAAPQLAAAVVDVVSSGAEPARQAAVLVAVASSSALSVSAASAAGEEVSAMPGSQPATPVAAAAPTRTPVPASPEKQAAIARAQMDAVRFAF